MATIQGVTLLAGAPLNIPLNGSDADGDPLSYSVSILSGAVDAALSPSTNHSLKITVDSTQDANDATKNIHGTMILQLFEDLAPQTTKQIIDLVNKHDSANKGFYDGSTFHRVINNFMIQGGQASSSWTGPSASQFDDEFNSSLMFTGSGLLAMAKTSVDDTNTSQFFITSGQKRELDFNYSIFGLLTEGDDIREAIENVDTYSSKDSPSFDDSPKLPVVMTKVAVIQDRENGVLRLSAPKGTPAYTYSMVKVTVSDGHSTDSKVFGVLVMPDTTQSGYPSQRIDPPYLLPIDPVRTTINTPVTFQIPARDITGGQMYYSAKVVTGDTNLEVSVDSTGRATVTPKNNSFGVFSIRVKVGPSADALTNSETPWSDGLIHEEQVDCQVVPVYVAPPAPTVERLLADFDTGASASDAITSRDNTADKKLKFHVTNLVTGAEVTLYADGEVIVRTKATGTAMDIETNGTAKLADKSYKIVAVQAFRKETVNAGNLQTKTDLISPPSAALTLEVDTRAPAFTSTPVPLADVGYPYSYAVRTDHGANAGVTYGLDRAPEGTLAQAPEGTMTIDAATGVIRWTPTAGQLGPQAVTVKATDKAGNAKTQGFTITVNNPPVLSDIEPQTADEGSLLRFTADADVESVPFRFSLRSGAPKEARIDPVTGVFTWTPGENDGGTTPSVWVRVTDAAGVTVEQEVKITVNEVDQPPQLSIPSTVQLAFPGQQLRIAVNAWDPDLLHVPDGRQRNPIRYSLEPGAPAEAAIDETTGVIAWNVLSNQKPGTARLTVRATEVISPTQDGLSTTGTLTIQVIDPAAVAFAVDAASRSAAGHNAGSSPGRAPAGTSAARISSRPPSSFAPSFVPPPEVAALAELQFSGSTVAAALALPESAPPPQSALLGMRITNATSLGDSGSVLPGQAAASIKPKDWDSPTLRGLEENAKPDRDADSQATGSERNRQAASEVPPEARDLAVDWLLEESDSAEGTDRAATADSADLAVEWLVDQSEPVEPAEPVELAQADPERS